jgi:hypothetical protein
MPVIGDTPRTSGISEHEQSPGSASCGLCIWTHAHDAPGTSLKAQESTYQQPHGLLPGSLEASIMRIIREIIFARLDKELIVK